jgi:hypothetical protein
MSMVRQFRLLLIAAAFGMHAMPALAQAPRQLYNKTVLISWSTAVSQTAPDGQRKNVTTAVHRTIYVSSTGRLFERASRSTPKGRKESENAPGATQNAGGEATGLHFEGNRLVGAMAFVRGARRFVATFDSSFSSCTLAVTYGHEGGGYKRKGVDGVMYTIDSMVPSGESCSIRDGNPFG